MTTTTVLERVWGEDVGNAKNFPPRPPYSSPTSPPMSVPIPRPTSPTRLPFRFGGLDSPKKTTDNSDSFGARVRRASSSRTIDYGREAMNRSIGPVAPYDRDTFTTRYHSSSHYEIPRPSTADGPAHMNRKSRNSLLVAATDVLGFKFGRRKPSVRQPPMPIILPDVIEISAHHPDKEGEERERLRNMAAQSIGLAPVMMQQETRSMDHSVAEEDEDEDTEQTGEVTEERHFEPTSNDSNRSPHDSNFSVPLNSPTLQSRYRSASLLGHSRANSVTLAPVPPFPSTPSALLQFKQTSSTIPKYYPPSSLRIFALSKSWRSRFMVLSTPTALVTRSTGPSVSYLHLFKSSGPDEIEIERLEINEESVVFVADEEVGGRKHVIKVGGLDVGAMKKELNHEECGKTMWFLQITDTTESQKWITIIKTAILGQRTLRAGLGPASALGAIEPRGDMDVMFSMRAQGLVTSPISSTTPRSSHGGTFQSHSQQERNYASSVSSHSLRSQATGPKSSTGAVSTLKGLFSGTTRPRSPSRAASIESERQQPDREQNEDSFASMGSNLLSMLRSNPVDVPLSSHASAKSLVMHPNLPFSGPIRPAGSNELHLDRKIIADGHPVHWNANETALSHSVGKDRANRTLSLGALSLQPPPRKRWTSIGPSTHTRDVPEIHKLAIGTANGTVNSSARSFQDKISPEPPASPSLAGFSFGTPEQRPRAPSLQSVSTIASGEKDPSLKRSSSSTKRSSGTKRWSRQGVLPQRLTPPTGPPPSVPPIQTSSLLQPHPYAGDQSANRSPSVHSATSQKSVISSLPSFSKRASGSSAFSVNSSSTSHSSIHIVSRPSSSHRSSMPPPPRPAPTFALPPAPEQETSRQDPPQSVKSSLRDSVTSRAFRLSMIAPKPPPSTVLPPRPDETEDKAHRKSSSSGSSSYTKHVDSTTTTTSTASSSHTASTFPPSDRPLPPTPPVQPATPSASRHASIKQRLRILSSPSPSGSQSSMGSSSSRLATIPVSNPAPYHVSPPVTPIAEKITYFQNDPSFLQIQTPIIPSSTPPPHLFSPPSPPPSEEYSELISLSPPPRRGSKQISVLETELESSEVVRSGPPTSGEHKLLSLSRPGSVVSLGFVSL